MCRDSKTGVLRELIQKDFWYQYHVSNPLVGTKNFNKKQFCMSYKSYFEVIYKVKLHEMFYPWSDNKPAVKHGCQPSSLELLLLRFLQYLGRGWSFDT